MRKKITVALVVIMLLIDGKWINPVIVLSASFIGLAILKIFLILG